MNKILASIQQFFSSPEPLPSGIYHYQSPPTAERQYRMHLRVEENGRGLLILNAETVLHLNRTAAEYAYHIIQQTPEDQVIRQVSNRYHTKANQVREDFLEFQDKIQTMIDAPDLDPELYLDISRERPFSGSIAAPYRADCAITYQLPQDSNPDLAPTRNVDRELSTAAWKTIIDKTWEAGIPHLTFTGGEPTLREDLFDLIRYAEKKGQVTGLLSDGYRLEDEGYFQELLQTGLDHLLFVLTPSRERSWTTLKAILQQDLHTTVHITIHEEIAQQMEDMLHRLHEMGANALSLSLAAPQDPALISTMQAARARAAEVRLPLKWNLPVPYSVHHPVALETVQEDAPRGAGRAWIYIEPDGDVLPAQGEDRILGNLVDDDWAAVWSNRP